MVFTLEYKNKKEQFSSYYEAIVRKNALRKKGEKVEFRDSTPIRIKHELKHPTLTFRRKSTSRNAKDTK